MAFLPWMTTRKPAGGVGEIRLRKEWVRDCVFSLLAPGMRGGYGRDGGKCCGCCIFWRELFLVVGWGLGQ